MRNQTKRGFTLIEILIVAAIIGILASMVLLGVGRSRESAKDARRISDLNQVRTVLELYYNSQGNYPVQTSSNLETNYGEMADDITGLLTSVKGLPHDSPSDYGYESDSDGSIYTLSATLSGLPPAGYDPNLIHSINTECNAKDPYVYCVGI